MSKVTYEYLFGNEPLFPTYMQLQMANQSIRFLEGIAKDVMVRIHDQYAPTDFMVLDMGEEEDDTPIILGRSLLNTTNVIIYVGSRQVHFQFLGEKVRCYFNSYTTYEQPKEVDVDITPLDVPADHPTVMQDPMTQARMRQLNLEVSSFLSENLIVSTIVFVLVLL